MLRCSTSRKINNVRALWELCPDGACLIDELIEEVSDWYESEW
jgi:hypothetical protein